jgi:hypothetical protein
MTDEDNIRFGLSLNKDKPFANAVMDRFDEMDTMLQRERQAYKAEIAKLRTENQNYKQAYFDQWYNNGEIEKCWNIIGGYNRKHLELHEAIREYIRNKEWKYRRGEIYYQIYSPLTKETIGVCCEEGKRDVIREEPH